MSRALVLALALALASAGCQTLTGRSAGQWVDDRAVTARVKARLAAAGASTLTRIHVDTFHGIVYLTGVVEDPELKARAEAIAEQVPSVRLVVNNLHVSQEAPVAASPPAERDLERHPVLAHLPGIHRLDLDSGTPAWTRYAAYDAAGRRVATVYAVTDRSPQGVADLDARGLKIDHVSFYPSAGSAPSYVVLWHLDVDEAARLR